MQVRGKPANGLFLIVGRERNECVTTQQAGEVFRRGLLLRVGWYVLKFSAEKIKNFPHGRNLISAESRGMH